MRFRYIKIFKDLRMKHIKLVGGKTASLGELKYIGIPVPDGFAVTSKAYWYFIRKNKLEQKIRKILKAANIRNSKSLEKAGKKIRELIINAEMPPELKQEIMKAFHFLKLNHVAVRSSATAEDIPEASFAGQHESFLNVTEKDIIIKVKKCFASLFTDRAISYRLDKGFSHMKIALSVAVQNQIFSKASGVMFTLEPDSGHRNFIYINGSWGLGDYIVQGKVNPDEYLVLKHTKTIIEKSLGSKKIMEIRSVKGVRKENVRKNLQNRFTLTDKEILYLTKLALKIEKHYKEPMDIEWAKDSRGIYILQARPETVHSKRRLSIENYELREKGKIIAEGESIGRKIGTGKARIILNPKKIKEFKKGEILVTDMTDPDWEPIMRISAGIITEKGGRTAHAAIVSREMGIPCIVGVKNATKILKTGKNITIDCTQEVGRVYSGILKYIIKKHNINKTPKTKTKIYLNIANPDEALSVSQLPVDGVGLAREEFIIASIIGVHPLALKTTAQKKQFTNKLASGIGKIAASFYPRPVILRFSDFKTNEYRNLKEGSRYEPKEENPMIGWRGASRYMSRIYEPAFRLECKAVKKLWNKAKLHNIKLMIPFCRTLEEAKKVLKIIKSEKLKNEIGVMAELPSNILLADKFSEYFKFFSIGSNDLTQLTLGMDRDSQILAKEFDERNPAVLRSIQHLIKTAHKYKRKVGICGDAPSTFPEFTKFLVKNHIDSISVNPDVALETKLMVSKIEKN